MSTTRSGDMVSPQIGKMGIIGNLNNSNFQIPGTQFNLKNDGETAVILAVNLWSMKSGEFVQTRFDIGWNPEIIREIQQTSLSNLNLKWGY
ncbi:MAG: hypothetical protein EZS26_000722 [Candidatus Ordinivivax streblomastigis]|uniref:Uncharacterized protein n=1 Tax=Candidatus Ordinivivax streblomastigis TaxID=2540710 RepID=A0A5M8P3R4_9BACT|nr:MAG: hypothetical protein EZS26_000722 [Candidatus Ordinivivax streblomastigis]